ncbi:MAG: DUF1508 domain-containing protein [Halobacteriaceae archaeon]
MALGDTRRTLFEWYDKYVGEAASRREVYGYWTFVLGYVVGISGVLVYLLGPGAPDSPLFLQIREVAIVLSALGLSLAMLGIAFQLPVSRLGVRAASAGAVIAVAGVGWFVTVYPNNWLGPSSPQRTVIAVYVAGVGLMAGVAVLVPVLTGERSLFSDRDADHAIIAGEADRGGLFAVYRQSPADWRWRLLEQEAVADGVEGFASRPDAEGAVDVMRSKVSEAGLLEINTAAFRLYGGDDTWRWDLLTEGGDTLATGAERFDDRDAAEEAVSVLKEDGPDAALLTIDGAAFQVQREGTRWRWRLVGEGREPLALAPDTADSRDAGFDATDAVRDAAGAADVLALEHVGFEVRETDAGYTWRIVDRAGAELGAATATTDDRAATRARIDDVRESAADAPVFADPDPHFELVADEDWHWRFDSEGRVVATDAGAHDSRADAEDTIETIQSAADDADVVEGTATAVELYRDDGWRWRLVAPDRTVIQRGTAAHDSRADAEDAAERAAEVASAAELVEFEEAAFQLYEAAGGDWRWRLVEEGGELLADSGEDYETREAAASGMTVLKENAPDADLLEIDDAAIELFREDGEWGWRVVDETGETVAEGPPRHESKAAAKSAAEEMRESFPAARTDRVGRGAFQVYERTDDGAEWHWRVIAADGRVLAAAAEGETTRDRAVAAIESFRDEAPAASSAVVETFAFVLGRADGGWTWRLVDLGREAVATGAAAPDRNTARETVDEIRADAADADVFELTDPVFSVAPADDGWTWTLVDADWTTLAEAPEAWPDRTAATDAAERVGDLAPDAGELSYEDAAFELFEDEDGWRWRFIDESERELAESPVRYPDREAARATVDRLRGVVPEASVLEIETASFELYEAADASGWKFRLVDRDGDTVARSVRTYDTRADARDGMGTLKERAPEAGVVVAG